MSSHFSFMREIKDQIETIEVIQKDSIPFSYAEFCDKLNDYKLREIIRVETKDINTILFVKAFGDLDE